jgi:hypothetical protein
MLTNTIIVLTATASILILLDFLLSDNIKKMLSDWVILAWSKLEDWSRLSIFNWLERTTLRAVICVLAFLCMAATATHISGITPGKVLVGRDPITGGIFAAGVVFLSSIVKLLTRQPLSRTERIVLILGGISLLLGAAWLYMEHSRQQPNPEAVFFVVFIAFGIPLVFLFVLFWMALLRVLLFLVRLLEFVFRRIAEYSRGPVLAFSVILGAIVGLYKAFGN